MPLSEKISSLRAGLGLSQEELAEKLGVSRQSVSKWETGQSVPELEKIVRLADLFGVSVDELAREGEAPRPESPRPEPPGPEGFRREEKRGLTGPQTAGVCLELTGLALDLLGLVGEERLLVFIGTGLILLGLPLLLAKKHPWLSFAWMGVALSLPVLNPYTSVTPWGLLGGARLLLVLLEHPEAAGPARWLGAGAALARGLAVLALLLLTWRAWRTGRRGAPQEDTPRKSN